MKLISFSRFSRNTLILLCVSLFSCIMVVSLQLFKKKTSNHLFVHVGILCISVMLAGIFEVISLCRQNRVSNSEKIKKRPKEYSVQNSFHLIQFSFEPQKNKLKRSLLVICVSFILFSTGFFFRCITIYNNKVTYYISPLLTTIQIVLVIIFSKVILHYSFHRHHLVAIIIVIIGIFVNTLETFKFVFTIDSFIYLLFLSLYSLKDVLEKYILSQNFISPYMLLFYEGSISIILNFIIALISSYTLGDKHSNIICLETIFENFRELSIEINRDKISILYILLLLISSMGYYTFSLLTIYYYNPTYIYVTDNIGSFFMIFIDLIMNYETTEFNTYYFISILGGILFFVGSCFFNEIIILHFCGLDYNTKKEIEKRAFREKMTSEVNELLPQNEDQLPINNSIEE